MVFIELKGGAPISLGSSIFTPGNIIINNGFYISTHRKYKPFIYEKLIEIFFVSIDN